MAIVLDEARSTVEPVAASPSIASGLRWARRVVVAAALVFVGSGLVQAWTDSPTVDEGVDLASGLTYWVHHDLRMSPEHPVLPKLVAALPALAADPVVPKGPAWEDGAWFDHADDVISANDRVGRLRLIVFLSRLLPLAQAVACGALLWALARRLFGEPAGLLAAGLWCTTPFVLGLGHVQSLDVSFALATLAVCLALLRHRERLTLRAAVVVGVALAGALLTRHTAIVLLPVALAVVAVGVRADRRTIARTVALVGLVAYAGLWVGYRAFDLTPPRGASGERFEAIVEQASDDSLLARAVLAVPAPIEWQAGFGYLMLTSEPRASWLFGQAYEGARPWFFPGSLVAKVQPLALGTLVLGPLAWIGLARERRRAALAVVAAPGAALLLATMAQPLNLGLRLVLPSVALLIVAASPVVAIVRGGAGKVALGALVATQLVAVGWAGTHSMAWSPPPFRPAHRYVSDSNVDFGQDLWRLREWSEGREAWVAVILPRGLERPAGSRALVGADPREVRGWVAVGVTSLTVIHREELSWLRAYCPVGSLGGGSTLIYRFDDPPRSEPGPDRPAAFCADREPFSRRTA